MPFDPTKLDPRTRPVQMTLDEACARISSDVYRATELFDRLEGAGLIDGNSHHARQKLATAAVESLRARWKNQADKGS